MTLPVGQISMSQVNTELGSPTTTTISLNQASVRTLAGVPSGQISMSNLQGKSNALFIDFTVIAGGGGGGGYLGSYLGGGGGAGALRYSPNVPIAPGSYPVTVGGGGAGQITPTNPSTPSTPQVQGQNGSPSVFNGVTATGGGRGGGYMIIGGYPVSGAQPGGSGGGGLWVNPTGSSPGPGGSGTTGGNPGGNGSYVTFPVDPKNSLSGFTCGGGGGAGGAGTSGVANYNYPPGSTAGVGGAGASDIITGTTRAGGGGAVASTNPLSGSIGFPGSGGSGGGGPGVAPNAPPPGATGTSGTANYGGGGGAAGNFYTGNIVAGSGGSGIVLIRYPNAGGQRATGGTVTNVGGYYIHTFTGSGTFVVS